MRPALDAIFFILKIYGVRWMGQILFYGGAGIGFGVGLAWIAKEALTCP